MAVSKLVIDGLDRSDLIRPQGTHFEVDAA